MVIPALDELSRVAQGGGRSALPSASRPLRSRVLLGVFLKCALFLVMPVCPTATLGVGPMPLSSKNSPSALHRVWHLPSVCFLNE